MRHVKNRPADAARHVAVRPPLAAAAAAYRDVSPGWGGILRAGSREQVGHAVVALVAGETMAALPTQG